MSNVIRGGGGGANNQVSRICGDYSVWLNSRLVIH